MSAAEAADGVDVIGWREHLDDATWTAQSEVVYVEVTVRSSQAPPVHTGYKLPSSSMPRLDTDTEEMQGFLEFVQSAIADDVSGENSEDEASGLGQYVVKPDDVLPQLKWLPKNITEEFASKRPCINIFQRQPRQIGCTAQGCGPIHQDTGGGMGLVL
jgi:hypothetical protein